MRFVCILAFPFHEVYFTYVIINSEINSYYFPNIITNGKTTLFSCYKCKFTTLFFVEKVNFSIF